MYQISKNNKDKINPQTFGFTKGFEPDPPKGPDTRKSVTRSFNYDFVVDWQMNEKTPAENGNHSI